MSVPEMAGERGSRQGPVRVFRIGEEPSDDLSDVTTAEERLAILKDLTERAWALSGRPFPSYPRSKMPVRVTRTS